MQTLSVDQLVGQTLGNHRVERLMGHGRLSAVYLAQNTITGVNGALTLFIVPVRFSQDAHARFIQRFRNEAGALTALQHPNVLPVHEYGEYQGHPYLVTPYMTNGSLADIVKSQGRCDHTEVLDILEQVVAGLEYAHRKGVIHGTLKPSNIVLGDDQNMLVAGFGLMHMLQMRGIEQDDRPYGHLLSIADTFLAAPEYIAPEIVQGQSIDKRSDVYALGIILFELLSGKPPFSGPKPLDVAKMHAEQSIPSLRILNPGIPAVLASVVNQALDRDPARRFQTASELVEAFAQASLGATGSVRSLDKVSRAPSTTSRDLPETPAHGYASGSWQLMPPIVTSKVKAVSLAAPKTPTTAPTRSAGSTGSTDAWQFLPPVVTGHLEAVDVPVPVRSEPAQPVSVVASAPVVAPLIRARTAAPPTLIPSVPEPSVPAPMPRQELVKSITRESRTEEKAQGWWEQVPDAPPTPQAPMASPFADGNQWDTPWSYPEMGKRPRPAGRSTRSTQKKGNVIGRRKALAMLATGGVVAAGILVGVNVAHSNTSGGAKATSQQPGNAPAATQNLPAGAIATTKMAPNSAVAFNNKQDLLIRLADGNFVAYDRACTHVGVFVNYDPATKMLVCPAHGAIFDPAQNAKVLQGPATLPLKAAKVSVKADGTITMV